MKNYLVSHEMALRWAYVLCIIKEENKSNNPSHIYSKFSFCFKHLLKKIALCYAIQPF